MKENANPIIHTVKRRRQRNTKNAKELSELRCRDKSIIISLVDGICGANAFDDNNIINDAIPELFGINEIDFKNIEGMNDLNLGPPRLFLSSNSSFDGSESDLDSDILDQDEIFELLRDINDPEHPNLTLEQLSVVQRDLISVKHNDDESIPVSIRSHHSYVDVQFT